MYVVLSSHFADAIVSGRVPRLLSNNPQEVLSVAREIVKEPYVENVMVWELSEDQTYSAKDSHGYYHPDEGPPAKIIVAMLWRSTEKFFHDFEKKIVVNSQ